MKKTTNLIYKQKVFSLLIASSLSLFLPLGNIQALTTTSNTNTQQKVIVTFKDNASTSSINQAEGLGKVQHKFQNIKAATMNVTSSAEKTLLNDPNVQSVEPDITLKIKDVPENWGVPKVNAPSSWNSGLTGKGVKVGVIDTGIYPDSDLSIAGGVSVVSYTSSYTDDNGHGTAVAGVIGSKNNSAVVGVAPDVQLYAIKALDQNGQGNLSDIISGIDWAINNHMNVINMSLGTPVYSQALQTEVDKAYNSGVLVVAAAGNESGAVDYPANFSSAIAVSATDQNNQLASFSNYGSKIEVAAPGVNILSTYINNQYAYLSGTSLAAPFVTGDLALLKELYPTLTASQLRAKLDQSVTDIGTTGKDTKFGYGLIQTPTKPIAVITPTNFVASNTSQTTTTLSWDSQQGANSYQLYRNGTLIMNSNVTSYTDQHLIPNTKYTYQLKAKNSVGTVSSPASLTVTTQMAPPGTISKVYATNVTSHSITLNWTGASYSSSYTVQRNGITIYTGPNHSFVDKNLDASTTYQYQVYGVNSLSNGPIANLSVSTSKEKLFIYEKFNYSYTKGNVIPISLIVKDSLGRMVPNATVNLTIVPPKGTAYQDSSLTDSNGNVSFNYNTSTSSVSGAYRVNLVANLTGCDSSNITTFFLLR